MESEFGTLLKDTSKRGSEVRHEFLPPCVVPLRSRERRKTVPIRMEVEVPRPMLQHIQENKHVGCVFDSKGRAKQKPYISRVASTFRDVEIGHRIRNDTNQCIPLRGIFGKNENGPRTLGSGEFNRSCCYLLCRLPRHDFSELDAKAIFEDFAS